VKYLLVDDRHFLVTGFRRDQLHAPFWTESNGKRVALFPIDEHLRYLIPFRPPAETVAYLRDLRGAGHQLAVLADDGEKFGGWPGTKEWVYDRGWLAQFMDAIEAVIHAGEVRLSTLAEAFATVPSGGLAYLPTASYREMESWSLTPPAASRLHQLEKDLGPERMSGPDAALVRGSHWRNFQVRYPESNRMHKKMQALSRWCRQVGDPPVARRALGRAQCNDAYWHGVFGGLYLPHLRHAIWRQLAIAERELRRGASLAHEILDFDCDGQDEIWVHSSAFSAVLSPGRGASLEELTLLESGLNLADVLTRRWEAYHEIARDPEPHGSRTDGAASIHDIGGRLRELPPVDYDRRAMFVDRVLAGELTLADYSCGQYPVVRSWAREPFQVDVTAANDVLDLVCRPRHGGGLIEKHVTFSANGAVTVSYQWDPEAFPDGSLFAPELSVAHGAKIRVSPEAPAWSFVIKTVSKSERGFDETAQGESLTPRWPVRLGRGQIEIG
jgi:alpha-amylase